MHPSFQPSEAEAARAAARGAADSSSGKGTWDRDASVRPSAWHSSWIVLCASGLLLLLGPRIVSAMAQKTKGVGWTTPPGSPSILAAENADAFFPARMRGAIVMAVEAQGDTQTVLTDGVANFSHEVRRRVLEDERVASFKPIVLGYYLDVMGHHVPRHLLQRELVSKDGRMTLLVIQATRMKGDLRNANAFLQEFCAAPPPGYTLHITGMPAVLSGDGCYAGTHERVNTRDMNFEVLAHAEACSAPVALLIITYLTKHVRLLLIPLLCLIVSFVVASAMMLPVMDVLRIPTDAPAAMGSVITALCLDYSLFMLSRFSEQYGEKWPLQQNVDRIQSCTARTISVSGFLIAIALFASILLPEENIQGTGICLGLATLACVGTSVLLTPALLLVAGKFFTGSSFVPTRWGDEELHGYVEHGDDGATELIAAPSRRLENPCWLFVMQVVDACPLTAVGLVLLLMAPLLMYVPDLKISGDRFALLPMDMPAIMAMRRVQDSFPVGALDPYAVIITAPGQAPHMALDHEVEDATGDLHKHDVHAITNKLGLSPVEVATTMAILADARDAGQSVEGGSLTAPEPALFPAASAGAAVAVTQAQGLDDAEALQAAVRAAHRTAKSEEELQQAVMAAAATLAQTKADAGDQHGSADGEWQGLHADGGGAGRTSLTNGLTNDDLEAVRAEALKLGVGRAAAAKVAIAAAKGGSRLHPAVLAAAHAGAAAGLGQYRNESTALILQESLRSVERFNISGAQGVRIVRVAADLNKDGKLAADLKDGKLAAGLKEGSKNGLESAGGSPTAPLQQETQAAEELVAKPLNALASGATDSVDAAQQRWQLIADVVESVAKMSHHQHGTLLLPSGFAAMLDLCDALQQGGAVASMVGPTWALHDSIDWVTAVALNVNATARRMYGFLLDSHVNGNRALLEVHTHFPSMGAGGTEWVARTRRALSEWEAAHPGYKAELSGGASEAADTRDRVLESMTSYLLVSTAMIVTVVYFSFRSVMIPLRLALALVFTLAATYGAAAILYQTTLLHGIFPHLRYFDGISYEVLPVVTGVAIALGLDYDIFLVSRIAEFRLRRFTDRASIFRGVLKTGEVISGAGLIMALAFSGLCFSNKLLFQQFGTILIFSVLLDTFVVRTVFVPALMLVAQQANWWPRRMPPAIHDALEGEVESSGGLSKPMLGGTALGDLASAASCAAPDLDWYAAPGMIA